MTKILITAPQEMAAYLNAKTTGLPSWADRLSADQDEAAFVTADPRGQRLGSGGGTVNLLHEGWRSDTNARSSRSADLFERWIEQSQKLILHAGGESRRLPAYAAVGKAFMPLPQVEGLRPRLVNQMLADFQLPAYSQTLIEAGEKAAALITAGDVWLDFDPTEIPSITSDISGIGMIVSPEVAQHFGVFFVRKDHRAPARGERSISFFKQKPSPAEIRRYADRYDFFVDTGMWLLSAKAVQFLFARCGWDTEKAVFGTASGRPEYMDLYTEVGCALGTETTPPAALRRFGFDTLATSVIPLQSARFYHLGSSRQLLESIEQIQRHTLTPQRRFCIASGGNFLSTPERVPAWVEGADIRRPIRLDGYNVLTGLPARASLTRLPAEACLDIMPVGADAFVVRPYHIDDLFRGKPGAGGQICGQDAAQWLSARGLAGADQDVFNLRIYPILVAGEITQELIDWFFAEKPSAALTERLVSLERISSAEIPAHVNFNRYFAQRREGYAAALKSAFVECSEKSTTTIMEQDFAAIAAFCTNEAPGLKRWLIQNKDRILSGLTLAEHQARFLMLLAEMSSGATRDRFTREAFGRLQAAMVSSQQLAKSRPQLSLKEDQIVWGRSPVRLDLAGGWTDTPPFCLEAGGAVLNVAVLLNGQPPIQVFIRPTANPTIQLRSIDLGSTETVTTYAELASFRDPRGHFSLPKAALAMAGFLPEFYGGKAFKTLKAQLTAFGGGLEISLLSAVPKGSGLGTSSILGATLLGAINRACGLNWDDMDLYNRVLGVEQLLTTGGGWQDQAGALFPSLKLVQTQPGPSQAPAVRYLSEHLLSPAVNQTCLLYYTGITRMAKGILQEIVRDMFLGAAPTLRTLELIRSNSWNLYQALQLGDHSGFRRCIARSWRLNRQLDAGTTTPEIEKMLAQCQPELSACKLLGAGGGGYILMCTVTPEDGRRLREKLETNPPNKRARFIDFSIAPVGLQVTVS